MKVKCITSHLHPIFVVGRIYETDGREISGDEIPGEAPWMMYEDLKIRTVRHTLASFERVDS